MGAPSCGDMFPFHEGQTILNCPNFNGETLPPKPLVPSYSIISPLFPQKRLQINTHTHLNLTPQSCSWLYQHVLNMIELAVPYFIVGAEENIRGTRLCGICQWPQLGSSDLALDTTRCSKSRGTPVVTMGFNSKMINHFGWLFRVPKSDLGNPYIYTLHKFSQNKRSIPIDLRQTWPRDVDLPCIDLPIWWEKSFDTRDWSFLVPIVIFLWKIYIIWFYQICMNTMK